ncbi:MAG: malonyl-ACP O-methyltransferase BioC [Proteobacteria bacterium]|nr:malonyl-ACP O-methyltransferase BioC [Pseudomonadota bacterium]
MSSQVTNTSSEQEQEQVFEQAQVRRSFDRAAESYDQFAVLQKEVCTRLLEKLDVVKIKPQIVLDAGTGTGSAIPPLFLRYKKAQVVALDLSENMLEKSAEHGNFLRAPHRVCADVECLPFADNSFDLVFSSLSLQWCNDLNAALLEAKRVLKPGGLFVFSTFGPDTLKELRQSWATVNTDAHVNQFIDMHDIGDALLQDGFAEPVMEAEILTVTYDVVDELMHDLRAIGANVTASGPGIKRGLSGRSVLQAVRERYESFRQQGVLPATYEIIYGHAWKSESSPGGVKNDRHSRFVEFER